MMNDDSCIAIRSRFIAPGWGCCKCRLYNGDHRPSCRGCNHDRCDGYVMSQIDRALRDCLERETKEHIHAGRNPVHETPSKTAYELIRKQIDESKCKN